MNKLAQAIEDYVDASIELALANIEPGEGGYFTSHPVEQKNKNRAFEDLQEALREIE